MNRIFNALFLVTLGLAGFLYLNQRGLAVGLPKMAASTPASELPLGPQTQKAGSSEVQTLTTLLADTELENELLASLQSEDSIRDEAKVHSVNCEQSRCQVLAEANIDAVAPEVAFSAHLKNNPKFGRSISIAPAPEKQNKRLLTLFYKWETQVSTTH